MVAPDTHDRSDAPPLPRLTIDRKTGSPHSALGAARRGDPRGWDDLVERYGRLVYSIPRRYGLCDADCEDVHQAVFVALFRWIDSIRDPERLPSWLITTAHRESWRIGKRRGRPVDLDERIADVGSPDAAEAETWEQQHLVRRALRRLGGRCEALLTALFEDGDAPNYEQIAARLDMRVGSIGPTRARCFRKLEPLLLELGVRPDHEDAAAPAIGASGTL